MAMWTAPHERSRHRCLVYEGDPSRQLPVVVPMLLEHLHAGWRCLYLGPPEMLAMAAEALRAEGVDTERETNRGALVFSADQSHLDGQTFDPERMIDSLCALVEQSQRDGFQGLYATGDMKHEVGTDENFERVLAYEAQLDRAFRDRPLRGICQYRRDVVPPHAVRDALLAHPSVYIGERLTRDNVFYIPPEVLLEETSSAAKQADWMCQQLLRVLEAESSRDEALAALRQKEAEQRSLVDQLVDLNHDLEKRADQRTKALEIARENLEAFVRMQQGRQVR